MKKVRKEKHKLIEREIEQLFGLNSHRPSSILRSTRRQNVQIISNHQQHQWYKQKIADVEKKSYTCTPNEIVQMSLDYITSAVLILNSYYSLSLFESFNLALATFISVEIAFQCMSFLVINLIFPKTYILEHFEYFCALLFPNSWRNTSSMWISLITVDLRIYLLHSNRLSWK